jgi:tRNA-splicing ligase RtcB
LKEKAQLQLGTVGSGNHYVDLLAGDDGQLWVANHFGSRGLGHTICTGFLNIAKGDPFGARLRESETPTVLDVHSDVGETYVAAMELAGEYAYAGRDYVIDEVLAVLGAEPTFVVHNHHNYAWREGDEIVVRKGATPLTREPAFIGGSMGDTSMIVRGTGEEIGNIASAPHGAGRVMSRTKAAGKFVKVKRNGRRVRMRDPRTGAIDWRKVQDELQARGIVVLGGGADEAPGVYKPLRDVLAAHPNVEILHTLEPIGVVMAGADEFDPYKD